MKRYCSTCETITPWFDKWCSCDVPQPGLMSAIFEYGESLGDIQITRLIRVLRTGALYEAVRGVGPKEQRVLLKVAHNDASEQIKQEAVVLAGLAQAGGHPMLPQILTAYQYAEGAQRPYGKTVFQDETKYYVVYSYAEGEFLRDMLTRNPQPWYQHAAWLTIGLCDVVYFIHKKASRLLLNLSPESIMVRIDKDGIPRPLLIDLGMVSESDKIDVETVKRFVLPGYSAPELLEGRASGPYGPPTDVYALGLLLYEMLAGHPAYPFKLRAPEDVHHSVRTTAAPVLVRTDLSADVTGIVMQAIDKAPTRRYPDVRSFAKDLRKKFGEVPAERNRRRWPRRVIAAVVVLVFVLLVWTVLMAAVQATNVSALVTAVP